MKPGAPSSRIAALLAGFLFALVCVEAVVRLAGIVHILEYSSKGKDELGNGAIICYGNSYTEGVGAPPGQSYCDHLQRLIDQNGKHLKVINRGVSFTNTYHMLMAVKRDLEVSVPGLAIIMTGEQNFANREGYSRFLSRQAGHNSESRNAFHGWPSLDNWKTKRLFSLLHEGLSKRQAKREYSSVFFPEISLSDGNRLGFKWLGGLYGGLISPTSLNPAELDEALSVLQRQAERPENARLRILPLTIARLNLRGKKDFPAALSWYRKSLVASDPAFFLAAYRDLRVLASGDSGEAAQARKILAEAESEFPDAGSYDKRNAYFLGPRQRSLVADGTAPAEQLKGTMEACRFSEENSLCTQLTAALLERLGRKAEAMRLLLKSLQVNPFGDPKILDRVFSLAREPGLPPEAVSQAETALAKLRERFPQEPILETSDASSIPAWIESDVEETAELLKQHGVPVLLLTYPPARDLTSRPSDAILKSLAERNAYPMADTYTFFQQLFRSGAARELYYSIQYGDNDDHLNSLGYKTLAGFLYALIEEKKLWPR